MNFKSYAALAALSILSCQLFADEFKQYAEALQSARNNQKSKNFSASIADAQSAVKLAADNDEKFNALFLMAQIYNIQNDFERMAAVLNEIQKMEALAPSRKAQAAEMLVSAAIKEKKYTVAEESVKQLLKMEKIPFYQRLNLVKILSNDIYKKQKRQSDAIKFYQELNQTQLSNSEKIAIFEQIADIHFNNRNFDWALKEFQKAAQLPEMSSEDTSRLLIARGKFYEKKSEPANAAAEYKKILDSTQFNSNLKVKALLLQLPQLLADRRFEEAEKSCNTTLALKDLKPLQKYDVLLALSNVLKAAGKFDSARNAILQAIKLPEIAADKLGDAKFKLVDISLASDNLPKAKADIEQYVLNDKTAEKALIEYAGMLFDRRDFAAAIPYLEKISTPEAKWGPWRRTTVVGEALLKAYYLENELDKFTALAAKLAANSRFSSSDQAKFAIFGQIVARKTPINEILKQQFPVNKFTNDVLAQILSESGKFLVSVGENISARTLFNEREKLFAPVKRNELIIKYQKNAPYDIGSWLNSPLLKDAENRANVDNVYGEREAANLYTDVMAAGRVVGDAGVQADKETYFYACYDDEGIKLFFVGVDSKVDEIMNRQLPGSGYEMYLALGENAPAYQWMFDQPGSKIFIPTWNSPHKFYRNLNDYVTLNTAPVENGIASCMSFSWELAYDRLPKNGDTWPFELIRWTRGGGVTWGGKSVWQIGNWGRWKFDGLTPEVLRDIKKKIIFKAVAKYKAQNNANTGGLIAIWQDAELGDIDFYNTTLKPKVEKLNKLAEMVKSDMTPEVIDQLYLEAVPDWFDFEYTVSELRRNYLLNRQLAK